MLLRHRQARGDVEEVSRSLLKVSEFSDTRFVYRRLLHSWS